MNTVPLTLPRCRMESQNHDGPDRLLIHARGLGHGARCPACGRPSRAVHSRYHRRPSDLPSFPSATVLKLELRRFYCRTRSCSRHTFAELWPGLVAAHARRTGRLADARSWVGVACGGETGARLLAHLRMPASAATVLRLIKRAPLPDVDPPRHIGVDDLALRKGCRYGTIVVDLDQRRVVDLLHDLTATTLADWLDNGPTSGSWPGTARSSTPAAPASCSS